MNKYSFLIVLFLISILVFNRHTDEENIELKGIITVGLIDDVYARGGLNTSYKFIYKTKVYRDTKKGMFSDFSKGKRCYVKFLADNPEKSILVTHKGVPLCIDTITRTWVSFPNCD